MPILDQHCFCCVSLRKGALVSTIFFLLVSAATALLYVWELLELLQRTGDFDTEAHQDSILILTYVVIALHGVVMVIASIIMFIGAFCYSAGSAGFFSVVLAIGTVLELGVVIYMGIITEDQLGGLINNPYVLFLVIWYVVRAIWNIHLVVASWSLFELFKSKGGLLSGNQ
jgi:TRAP-type mannitol/chloroaromatic compound transport system permease small subunit